MFVNVDDAKKLILQGKVIAYPTEAVFGLGCDPFNDAALEQLLDIKNRAHHKGFIVIISQLSQLQGLIDEKAKLNYPLIQKHWPGPTTFLIPKNTNLPSGLTGQFDTIAVRLTNHPIAKALCERQAIVSTSANISGSPALKSAKAVDAAFPNAPLFIVEGDVGSSLKPSTIIDMQTGNILRD